MKKIVIIEDDEMLAGALQEILEMEGLAVETINDGAQAAKKVGQIGPDLLLLDYRLPGNNGIDIVEKLRESENFYNLPIVMMTAGHTNLYKDLNRLNICAALQKPFEISELLNIIQTTLL